MDSLIKSTFSETNLVKFGQYLTTLKALPNITYTSHLTSKSLSQYIKNALQPLYHNNLFSSLLWRPLLLL